MNVTQFHLTPTVYARANHLKTEVVIALTYAARHANKAQEIADFFEPIEAAAAAGTLIPLTLKPQRYMRAGELRAEVKAALNFAKAYPNKRARIAAFFAAVAAAASPHPDFDILPAELDNVYIGIPVSTYIYVGTGSHNPTVATITAGSLPDGLTMDSDGVVTGTPSGSTGAYEFTVRIVDADGAAKTKSYTWQVATHSEMAIEPSSGIPDAIVGVFYEVIFSVVEGGHAPYTWSVVSGSYPSGLSISVLDGDLYINGTPDAAGPTAFTVRATDTHGKTKDQACDINVIEA